MKFQDWINFSTNCGEKNMIFLIVWLSVLMKNSLLVIYSKSTVLLLCMKTFFCALSQYFALVIASPAARLFALFEGGSVAFAQCVWRNSDLLFWCFKWRTNKKVYRFVPSAEVCYNFVLEVDLAVVTSRKPESSRIWFDRTKKPFPSSSAVLQ